MGSPKELGRLVNGLSLVAKEIVGRSQAVEAAKNGDLQCLIKKAILSATDITGLTKGKVRILSNPSSSNSDSVVHFTTATADDSSASSEEVTPPVAFQQQQQNFSSFDDKGDTDSSIEKASSSSSYSAAENSDVRDGFRPVNESELQDLVEKDNAQVAFKRRKPRERRVPSTPFTRALGFAGLGAGLAWGTVQESARRLVFGTPRSQDNQSAVSPFLSEQNAQRLALALCRMRGAALKIGQMLSIQDESLVPPPILAALDIVRQGADVMPRSQLNQVLDAELGLDWSSKLTSFDYEPIAAASIGQVHRAVTKDGMQVAMKIQYPGVADSIESDIENVRLLLDYTNLIPEGLYLDRAMKVGIFMCIYIFMCLDFLSKYWLAFNTTFVHVQSLRD
ncbi:hypothetical protein I3760_08G083900 [Carya illinoinensis]|uniref:ABC1 atypical kinase-like domain-containing protein n=1 Tax=Carya illinoinensis TaxID=32201 RepID=A0A922EA87_CARIL|nr:hypothetical protein I3760_08G083900 [Carya illinoinensis]KAG6699841.1 hypothetical protein I3842_08G083200 [Carya illinoinensis]